MTIEPGTTPAADSADPVGDVPVGDDGLRAASARLAELPGLPVAEHVAVFEEVNRLLAGTLAELDAADGGEPAGSVPARSGGSGQPARPGQFGRPGPGAAPVGRPRPGPPMPGPGPR
ncbi:hypothetical protein I6A84_30735 [Frankia sp. CNm7]|uniref:Uncharacterized protein n=1 Tax=Frankia nepalensis TaxID=1836974 RepID=A0A937RN83_9ACTN|nr:hypothetical protein [Frankia nepalensis]MBL7502604.1 hypothetical protein [Frankia nepalensis]MBL7509373.1 hypothetical protein [Frankia nepalensis]MBL7522340.1 hypothetical protein [Frankia nepalensis]MBL7628961.1 hypothetical protein [Frankia nepalensis]